MANRIYDKSKNEYKSSSGPNIGLRFLYNTLVGRFFLKILTKPIFSTIVGFYMNSFLSKWQINRFIKKNNINMDEYEVNEYRSFIDFFIRKIKEGKRKIIYDSSILISPADSRVSRYKITKDLNLNIKNSVYTMQELLQDEKLSKEYEEGECLVFRLCVDDYHRYIYVDGGVVKESKKIKGVLHTVNPISYKRYKVYAQNSREWEVIETQNFGKVVQIEVGALCVGRIKNFKHNKVERGQEKGYFEFGGSTIVVLLKKDTVNIDKKIIENSSEGVETIVKQGEKVGEKVLD